MDHWPLCRGKFRVPRRGSDSDETLSAASNVATRVGTGSIQYILYFVGVAGLHRDFCGLDSRAVARPRVVKISGVLRLILGESNCFEERASVGGSGHFPAEQAFDGVFFSVDGDDGIAILGDPGTVQDQSGKQTS